MNKLVSWGALLVLGAWLCAFIESPEDKSVQGEGEKFTYDAQAVELWQQGEAVLETWDLATAKSIEQRLAAQDSRGLLAAFLSARILFYQGEYKQAAQTIAKLGPVVGSLPPYFRQFAHLAATTAQVSQKFKAEWKVSFPQFTVRAGHPNDAILKHYLEKPLKAMYDRLTEILKVSPKAPIRLEIYPTLDDFIAVSTLTRANIETSGTIALCKFNRLMVVSPRVLLIGYPWLDTVAHELIHYLVIAKTGETVPIWLHEGIAKYLQAQWRTSSLELDKVTETILNGMLRDNSFVPFAKMHPSMAKLSSSDEASRAFAEVSFAVFDMVRNRGLAFIPALLSEIAGIGDLEKALLKTTGLSLLQYEQQMVASLKAFGPKELVADYGRLSFDKNKRDEEVSDVRKPEAQNYLHLGDLLAEKGYAAQALIEYGKGSKLVGDRSAKALQKIAQLHLTRGDKDKALAILDQAIALEPPSPMVYYLRGVLRSEKGQHAQAAADFEQVLSHNPFFTACHGELAKLYQKLGRSAEAQIEKRIYEQLAQSDSRDQ